MYVPTPFHQPTLGLLHMVSPPPFNTEKGVSYPFVVLLNQTSCSVIQDVSKKHEDRWCVDIRSKPPAAPCGSDTGG